jgi:hypothetical protein
MVVIIMTDKKQANVSKDEQVGFHKGALSTLAKEREEMMKIVQVVEQLMQMHIKALKDLGVDLEAQAKEAVKTADKPAGKKSNDGQLDELI